MNSFDHLRPLIEEIRNASGTPGLAIGIIIDGRTVYESYHGFRDVHAKLPTDRNTIFPIASLTKAMTSAAIGIMVEKRLVDWSTPLHEIFPEAVSSRMGELLIVDLLSHRSGRVRAEGLFLGSDNNILLPKEDGLRTFDYLQTAEPPRTAYMYNNFGYHVIGDIIERVSGQKYADFLEENLFQPLGMSRTFTDHPPDGIENISKAYATANDGSAIQISPPQVTSETLMFSAGSVRSSLLDLLRFYTALLKAANNESTNDAEVTTQSSLKGISKILQPHIFIPSESLREQSYALGWCRTQLPAQLNNYGENAYLVPSMPKIGSSLSSPVLVYHGGNLPGCRSAVTLLPESMSGIVVLQNSLGFCDATDWISQLLVENILGNSHVHDYLALARTSAATGRTKMIEVQKQLDEERVPGTKPRCLTDYVGNYYNLIGNFYIKVELCGEDALSIFFQGRDSEKYRLRHYHDDIFVWNDSYDVVTERGQYCRPYWFYKIRFESKKSEQGVEAREIGIDHLLWKQDSKMDAGEVFLRRA